MTRHAAALLLSIIAVLCFAGPSFGQALNTDEQSIVASVDAARDEAVAFLEKVVNVDSPTEDLTGVRAVGELFRKEFEAMGMTTRWIDMPADAKRAGHLIAETKGGRKGKRLLLLGHLDTVLRGEKFRRDGTRAFGTGIGDMKGGNVIVLYALKALHNAGLLKDTQIVVMFTGDEENSCDPIEVCRGDMIAAARRSDAALSFEGTIGNTATVGRRGSSSWRLVVDAKTGHSSQIFRDSMGYGAIYEAARILNEFRETLSKEKYLTFNPGMIVGGTTAESKNAVGGATGKTNVVAATAVVTGDLRFISEEQKETARAKMREIVAKSLPGTKATIKFEDGIPAMTPVEGNYELLRRLDQVSQDLGYGKVEALDPGDRGAGDIAFVSGIIPGLDGLGIGGGGNSHAKGEYADLASMPMLIKRAAVLIYRMTR
ncbi:MAG: M20/M25/M40 family metallo-hydrolase [Pyrinomonadaceae bacterium]